MYFGAHVSTAGGIDKAAERAAAMGAHAVQVFTQSPRMWRPQNHKPENIERYREICAANGIKSGVAHAIYLINLGSDNEEIYEKSVAALENTMKASSAIGLESVIFHVGSHKAAGLDSCLSRITESLKRALDAADDVNLLLENSAGQGGTIGRDTDELAQVIDTLDGHPQVGICLDSCHWYVSGVDVTDAQALDAALDEVDARIGLDRLRALHINDSKTPLGSNRDRHANIGEGEMGAGLATFLQNPRLQGLPALLEVAGEGDGPTAEELRKVRALHEGK